MGVPLSYSTEREEGIMYNGYESQDAFHAAMQAAWRERLSTPEGRERHRKDYGPGSNVARTVRSRLRLLRTAPRMMRRKHRHSWVYRPRTIGGWGVAACATCPAWDIY